MPVSLDDMKTPGDILRKALEKEREAFEFYGRLMDYTKIDMVRDLVAQLKDEENKHINLIEKMLTDMRLGHGG